jgi:hypothetical protein
MSTHPLLLIVRRGALRRFATLQRKTAQLNVKVLWDRRHNIRRQVASYVAADRRANDRRKADPFTWDTADFAVVTRDSSEREKL